MDWKLTHQFEIVSDLRGFQETFVFIDGLFNDLLVVLDYALEIAIEIKPKLFKLVNR